MIERRRNLSGAEFRSRYLQSRRPVIIEGGMEDWPARRLWSKQYLVAVVGAERQVEVMAERESDPNFEIKCDSHRTQMAFATFADMAFSDRVSNNAYMVANNQFLTSSPGLRLLQDVPAMAELLDPDELLGRVFFWFGPGGTITPLHYDVLDIILCQVKGHKRMRLFAPEQKPHLYNSVGVFSEVNVDRPDFVRYPLYRHAVPDEIVLAPGEMIFLPEGHWHQVVSLESSISVSFTNLRR